MLSNCISSEILSPPYATSGVGVGSIVSYRRGSSVHLDKGCIESASVLALEPSISLAFKAQALVLIRVQTHSRSITSPSHSSAIASA